MKRTKKKYQYMLTIGFFVLPFTILSFVIQGWYGHLEPIYKVKLEEYSKLKDDVNLLFIGSSTTWRNITTREFDRTLNEHGIDCTSYNFGFPLMRYGEVLFLLKEIRRLKPKNLKYVFFETFIDQDSRIRRLNGTRKFVFWHDFANTMRVIKTEWNCREIGMNKRIDNIYQHFRAFYFKAVFKGNGFYALNYIQKYPGPQISVHSLYQDRIKYGNLSLEQDRKSKRKRNKKFLEKVDLYRKHIEKIKRTPPTEINAYQNNRRDLYDYIMQWSETMGVQLIFFSSPNNNIAYSVKNSSGKQYPILRLNDINKFSSLYLPSRRFDSYHLNTLGAREASKYLADLFYNFLKTNKQKVKKVLMSKEQSQ